LLSDERVGASARDEGRAALFADVLGELRGAREDGDPDGAGALTRSLGIASLGTRASLSDGLRGRGDEVDVLPLRGWGDAAVYGLVLFAA
jgi:hypothetical protein